MLRLCQCKLQSADVFVAASSDLDSEYYVVLQRVLYVSQAAPGVDLPEVYDIIRASHTGNAERGLSGLLLFLDGWFAQILEGPAGPLEDTLTRIAADRRHGDLGLRVRGRAFGRLFPGQAMALRYRACLGDELLAEFGYRPGFPVADFPADTLIEMMTRACRTNRAKRAVIR